MTSKDHRTELNEYKIKSSQYVIIDKYFFDWYLSQKQRNCFLDFKLPSTYLITSVLG